MTHRLASLNTDLDELLAEESVVHWNLECLLFGGGDKTRGPGGPFEALGKQARAPRSRARTLYGAASIAAGMGRPMAFAYSVA